jgi:hypothetical protein
VCVYKYICGYGCMGDLVEEEERRRRGGMQKGR